MRIWSLVCVFGFGVGLGGGGGIGCGSRPAPAPVPVRAGDAHGPPSNVVTAASAGGPLCKPAPAGTPALVLPAIAASTDLKLDVDRPGGVEPEDWKGKMTVDGVVTASTWPLHAPSVHRLADGRSLLNDTYNANLLMLWDPRTKTLTELARGVLMRVPGHGMLVYTADGDNTDVGVFSDIDPAAPKLRELWRFRRSEGDTAVAGAIDGMPALVVRPAATMDKVVAPTAITLLCLSGAGVSSRFEAVVPAGFLAVGVDPVDGHRMLLLGDIDHEKLYASNRGFGNTPFDAEVAVLDLATGTHRSIGRVAGGWTQFTAIPHPRLSVAWSVGLVDPRVLVLSDEFVTLIDPATERVVGTAP